MHGKQNIKKRKPCLMVFYITNTFLPFSPDECRF